MRWLLLLIILFLDSQAVEPTDWQYPLRRYRQAMSVYGIAVDTTGSVDIAGESSVIWGSSPELPIAGPYGLFVLKLNSSGTYQWHTFYGAPASAHGIAIDFSGNIYVTGFGLDLRDLPSTLTAAVLTSSCLNSTAVAPTNGTLFTEVAMTIILLVSPLGRPARSMSQE